MRTGRPRVPDALNALRGNPGKRKRTPKAAAVVAEAPAAPADEWDAPMHLPEAARVVWAREMPRLRNAGYLRRSDLSAFEVYCGARSRWEKAMGLIGRRGMTYSSQSKHGTMERLRPEIAIIAGAERTMRTFMEGLALTTSSRMRAAAQIAQGQRQGELPIEPQPATAPGALPAASAPSRSPLGWVN